eukprot:Gb_16134 [translate_table: standard]
MPNEMVEKSGSNCGDSEGEQQQQGCVVSEEGDSQAGSPDQSFCSDVENYEDGPIGGTMLNEEVPSGAHGDGNQEGKKEVSPFREHDYIGLSDGGSSCTTQEEKNKGKDLDFGPKTKETELRLGPPPEAPPSISASTVPAAFQNGLQKNNTNTISPGLGKRTPVEHQGPVKASLDAPVNSSVLPVDSEGRAGRSYPLTDSLQRWNRQCFGEPHVNKFVYPKQSLIPSKETTEPRFFNNGHEVLPQAQDYSNGMAYLLTPKNTTTAGAKRVFSDAMGAAQVVRNAFIDARNIPNEGRMGLLMPAPSTTSVKTEMDSKVSAQTQPQPQALPLMYPWTSTWQINLEQQQRGSFGPFPPAARVMVGNIMAGNISINEAPHGSSTESRGKPSQENISGMRPPMAPPAPSEQQQKNPSVTETLSPPEEHGTSGASRVAPVVGWPPIRSFRKNLAPQLKPDIEGQTNASGNSSASADPGQTFGDSMFVKVNMDGVPIGRKIDLKAYDSYDKLSLALEEMFKRFINAQGSGQRPPSNLSSEVEQPSLLSGTDYVLTYEDNEGDRMLVGDVPWEMFVSTVKRLRIMKSSEARGLVPRQPLKPQGQVTQ